MKNKTASTIPKIGKTGLKTHQVISPYSFNSYLGFFRVFSLLPSYLLHIYSILTPYLLHSCGTPNLECKKVGLLKMGVIPNQYKTKLEKKSIVLVNFFYAIASCLN